VSDAGLARLGRVVLLGCGNMGGAMLRRWVEAGLPPEAITVVDRGTPDLPAGVRLLASIAEADAADTLVLAIKPQQFAAVTANGDLDRLAPRLTLSILAGVEIATLAKRVGAGTLVRAMPNLPVAIGKGVVALFADRSSADPALCDDAAALMEPLGLVEWIDDEARFDAVTALAGCGPGFVFRFADALAAAGVAMGLDEAQARRLAVATLEGAASMAMGAADTPAVLADRVASPGGSTREGLNVLDQDGALVGLMTATLAAATARNRAMAAETGTAIG
jgi:pyrroline-5-carboxylate reductase